MKTRSKVILISIVVIIIGVHVYFSLFHDWYANDVLDGNQFQSSISIDGTIVSIECPDGFTAIPEAILTSPQNNSKDMICLGEQVQFEDTEILRCGDEHVDAEGMVETVTCTMAIP